MRSFIQDISIAPLQVHYYSEAMFPLIYFAARTLACLVSSNIRDLCLLYASRKMLCALVEKSCAHARAQLRGNIAQRRSRHSTDTVSKFQAKAPQATASEGLAQGPCAAARAGFEP